MRVPTDVTVWLGVLSVAITIVYTIIKARAKAFLSFPGTGTDRSAITRESQLFQVDKALIRRWMQEKILEQCEQKLCRIRFVRRRFLKDFKEPFNPDLFNRSGFFSFLAGLGRRLLGLVDRIAKIWFIRIPQSMEKVIESTDAGSISDLKSAQNRLKMILSER